MKYDWYLIIITLGGLIFSLAATYGTLMYRSNKVRRSGYVEVNALAKLKSQFCGELSNSLTKRVVAPMLIEKHVPRRSWEYLYSYVGSPLHPKNINALWYVPSYSVPKYLHTLNLKADYLELMQCVDRTFVLINSALNTYASTVEICGITYEIEYLRLMVAREFKTKRFPHKLFKNIVEIAYKSYVTSKTQPRVIDRLELEAYATNKTTYLNSKVG